MTRRQNMECLTHQRARMSYYTKNERDFLVGPLIEKNSLLFFLPYIAFTPAA